MPGFFLGRNIRKVGIKLSHGKLSGIPGLMKDIQSKKAKLGNTVIDCSVRKAFLSLKPPDKLAQIWPGNLLRSLVKNLGEIKKIRFDIG